MYNARVTEESDLRLINDKAMKETIVLYLFKVYN